MTRTIRRVRAASVVLAVRAPFAAAAVVRARGGAIEGTISEGNGLVLSGVTVEADRTDVEGPETLGVTGGDGGFAIAPFAPGLTTYVHPVTLYRLSR